MRTQKRVRETKVEAEDRSEAAAAEQALFFAVVANEPSGARDLRAAANGAEGGRRGVL